MVKKYKKKPVVIEAVQYTGENIKEINDFFDYRNRHNVIWAVEGLHIRTLEGLMLVRLDDFIIKGVNGEYYPCKPNIFYKTYEEV